ncbi:uncharacterized protein LOC142230587 [Haematobia irritans]|uniref:uncharacterized protein LOC142230587 n=1 Tax=Haematobia irritans TaxID=7368 RepID=UPI003F506A2A
MTKENINGDSDILRPLTSHEVEELLQLYKQKYGVDNFQYLLIYNECRWKRKLSELKSEEEQSDKFISFKRTFYTHAKGDFRTHGTYVCLHQDIIQTVSFHTWQSNFKELLECLNETNRIQWRNGPLLSNVANEYSDEIKQLVLRKGITIQKARLCQAFSLDREKASDFCPVVIPDGYELATLQEHHAPMIYSMWANNKEGSLDYIKGLIKMDTTFGLYEKANHSLVGWIFRNEFCGMGILQVLTTEQRKGFGNLLARTMSYTIAKSEDINVTAWVVVGNVKSEKLFQSLGFKLIVIYEWIQLNKAE